MLTLSSPTVSVHHAPSLASLAQRPILQNAPVALTDSFSATIAVLNHNALFSVRNAKVTLSVRNVRMVSYQSMDLVLLVF